MLSHGQDTSMRVDKAGLTCKSVGFVEGKHHSFGKDSCDVDDSLWSLKYFGGGYAGSTMSTWRAGRFHNTMMLHDESDGTNVVERKELYLSIYQEWDSGDTNPLYVSVSNPFTIRRYILYRLSDHFPAFGHWKAGDWRPIVEAIPREILEEVRQDQGFGE